MLGPRLEWDRNPSLGGSFSLSRACTNQEPTIFQSGFTPDMQEPTAEPQPSRNSSAALLLSLCMCSEIVSTVLVDTF